jgi:hypothetical protein
MFEGQFTSDQWHHEAEDIARRNGIRSRRWGMRVTVYDDPTPANNGDYVLSYNLANTNRQSNSNWQKVADIGETWGGGGSVNTFGNGLTETGGLVQLGGAFTESATLLEVQPGQYFDVLAGDTDGPIISWGGAGTYEVDPVIIIGSNNLGSLQVKETSMVFQDDRVGSAAVGIEYTSDLSLNFLNNPRSIPDVGFVSGYLAGLPITPPTSGEDGYVYAFDFSTQQWVLEPNQSFYTFNNGLTLFANNVSLGGLLQVNTTIEGDGVYDLNLLDFIDFSVSSSTFTVTGIGSFDGILYAADYSANFVTRSVTDVGYTSTHIGLQAVDALVTNPTVAQNGYVIAWNNTNLEYELVAQSGGGGVTFGTVNQLPYMNAGGTDFSYEAGFEYNTTTNVFTAQTVTGTTTVISNNSYIFGNSSAGGSLQTYLFQAGGTGTNVGLTYAIKGTGIYSFTNSSWSTSLEINDASAGADILMIHNADGVAAAKFQISGSGGDVVEVDGRPLELKSGNAFGSSGNGDGAYLLVQSGQRRTAGAGIDGNMFLDYRNGNLGLTDNLSVDFEGGSKILYIQDSLAQPSASPADGVFLYPVTGELQVLNETGPVLSLAGRATIVTESGASVSLTQAHRGAIVKLTNAGAVTITLSDLGNNYTTTLLYTGTTSVSFTGYDNFYSIGAADQILDQYGWVYLLHETSNDWYAKGDLS